MIPRYFDHLSFPLLPFLRTDVTFLLLTCQDSHKSGSKLITQCQHTDDSVSEFYKSMDIQTDDGESVSTSFHGCAGEEMKLMHTFPQ